MGYRWPPLIALNEPEASLHPSAAGAAGPPDRLSRRAHPHLDRHALGRGWQDFCTEETGKQARRVVKSAGATGIERLKLSGEHADEDE
jgi:hypothetical protein